MGGPGGHQMQQQQQQPPMQQQQQHMQQQQQQQQQQLPGIGGRPPREDRPDRWGPPTGAAPVPEYGMHTRVPVMDTTRGGNPPVGGGGGGRSAHGGGGGPPPHQRQAGPRSAAAAGAGSPPRKSARRDRSPPPRESRRELPPPRRRSPSPRKYESSSRREERDRSRGRDERHASVMSTDSRAEKRGASQSAGRHGSVMTDKDGGKREHDVKSPGGSISRRGARSRVVPRYVVQAPRFACDRVSLSLTDCRQRYTNMYIPSDFFNALHSWHTSFPVQRSLALTHPSRFTVLHKDVAPISPRDAEFEPMDMDYRYSAKVMLFSGHDQATLFKKVLGLKVDGFLDEELDPSQLSKNISFLVGTKSKEVMAIGGAWSPSLDGANPESDPMVLVRTAIRTTRALTGIDLAGCTQWYKFVELRYRRVDKEPTTIVDRSAVSCLHEAVADDAADASRLDATDGARVDSVVIYVPDVWNLMPSSDAHAAQLDALKQALQSRLDALDADAAAATAAAQAAAAAAAAAPEQDNKQLQDSNKSAAANDTTSTATADTPAAATAAVTDSTKPAAAADAEQVERHPWPNQAPRRPVISKHSLQRATAPFTRRRGLRLPTHVCSAIGHIPSGGQLLSAHNNSQASVRYAALRTQIGSAPPPCMSISLDSGSRRKQRVAARQTDHSTGTGSRRRGLLEVHLHVSESTAAKEETAPADTSTASVDDMDTSGIAVKIHWSNLNVNTMKVAELREQLEARGLDKRGLKQVLAKRLEEALEADKNKEGDEQAAPDEPMPEASDLQVSDEVREEEPTKDGEQPVEEPKPTGQKSVAEASGSDEIQVVEPTPKQETPQERAVREREEKRKKEKEERELKEKKDALEKHYAVKDEPAILVYPNADVKSGKFDCKVMSLSTLLDYRDNKEHSFEVALFAEAFNQMLHRDNAYTIYKVLLAAPDRETLKKQEEEQKAEYEAQWKAENEKTTAAEEEEKVKQEESSETDAAATEQQAKDEDIKVLDEVSSKDKDSKAAATVKSDYKPPTTVTKIKYPDAQLAFAFWDHNLCGYLTEKDAEDIIYTAGLNLSRSQVSGVLRPHVHHERVHYLRLCESHVLKEDHARVLWEPRWQPLAFTWASLAAGNNPLLPVSADGQPQQKQSAEQNASGGSVVFEGAVVDIAGTLDKVRRLEQHNAQQATDNAALDKELVSTKKQRDSLTKKKRSLEEELTKFKRKLHDAQKCLKSSKDDTVLMKKCLDECRKMSEELCGKVEKVMPSMVKRKDVATATEKEEEKAGDKEKAGGSADGVAAAAGDSASPKKATADSAASASAAAPLVNGAASAAAAAADVSSSSDQLIQDDLVVADAVEDDESGLLGLADAGAPADPTQKKA